MEKPEDQPEICTFPDPVLKKVADPVKNIDQGIQDLAETMIRTMYAAPGVGLAANQIGRLERVIVVDLSPGKEGRDPCVLINPEIIEHEGEIVYEEACLSVIDFSAEVNRNARVYVRGLDREGLPKDIEGEGLLAVCLQHEIDHLNGILYIDHISSLKRSLYKRRLRKKLKKS